MSDPLPPLPRSSHPRFRPMAMLGILYVVFFFFAIGMLLIVPELLEVLRSVPPGPDQQAAAERAARDAMAPRLPVAFVLALVVTAGGAYLGILPGIKTR